MLVRRIGGVLGCRFRTLRELVWIGNSCIWRDGMYIELFELPCIFEYLSELLTVYREYEVSRICLPSLRNISI